MTDNSAPEIESNFEAMEDYVRMLREKILFGLEIYTFVSPTMLHTFLGTSTSAHVWKPILNQLIAEGLVEREEVTHITPHTLHERTQTYTILHLAQNHYPNPSPNPDSSNNDVGEQAVPGAEPTATATE
jgi:hypothetical protein